MHTHVGDGVEPLADVGVERVEAGDLAAGQEVFLTYATAFSTLPFSCGWPTPQAAISVP
jgi:hypothetical protein